MTARASVQGQCSLRLMQEQDLCDVMDIEHASYEFPWSEGNFRDCLKKAEYRCQVVIQRRQIIGYGIFIIAAEEAHVLNICIMAAARGKGFARLLLEELIDAAICASVQEIFLEVRPSNAEAINLYMSMGFNEAGRRPNYYNAGTGREDALIFVKSLHTRLN